MWFPTLDPTAGSRMGHPDRSGSGVPDGHWSRALIAIDGDAAVGGFYLNGWAALADLCVDVVAYGAPDCDGEVDGDASVDGGCDEMGGVVVGRFHADAAVGGFGEESFALPLFAVEDDIETAVDGGGADFAA